MVDRLDPDGRTLVVGDVQLRALGVGGTVEVHRPVGAGLRGAVAANPAFAAALDAADFRDQLTVEINDPMVSPGPMATRGGGPDRPTIELEVAGPGSGFGQVLLAEDEDGIVHWHLPADLPRQDAVSRASDRRRYQIPVAAIPPQGGPPTSRGPLGAIGKKILKVLVFRLLDRAFGHVGDHFASAWERTHRPSRLRPFTPDDHGRANVEPLEAAALADLTDGPALLFLHGTMSQAHSGFGTIPTALVERLTRSYGGRVLAFDHPTVSVTPTQNVRVLAELLLAANLPQPLTVDIVAHSRGGLVGRVLAEHGHLAGVPTSLLQVRRLVMLGTPNAGTVLADRAHWDTLLDTMTNLLDLVPSNPVLDTLEVVLAVLKQVAVGAFGGLDGIASMDPDGRYLRDLNQPGATLATYHAIAANYEPGTGAPLARFARDHLTDAIFNDVHNDLVVPTDGVYATNGGPGFPITNLELYAAGDGVDHSSFWTHERTAKALERWLSGTP